MASRLQISHWPAASFPFLISEGVRVLWRSREEKLRSRTKRTNRARDPASYRLNKRELKRTTNMRSLNLVRDRSRLTLSNLFLHKDLPLYFIFLLNTKLSMFTSSRTSKNKIDSEGTAEISHFCDHIYSHCR